jgi:Asp/Glu/hydantoin racemase
VDHVRCDVKNAVAQLDQADVILCTCSTLGPVIDALDNPYVLRIDTPAFDCAVAAGGDILVVICLESTREASQTLLATRAHTAQVDITQHTIVCAAAWAHFTAGDMDLFDRAIATDVRRACAAHPYNTVVLAQASMAGAAHLLADLGVPVFTTPQTAVDHALKIAQARA